MKYLMIFLLIFYLLPLPSSAISVDVPDVPEHSADMMPESAESLADLFANLSEKFCSVIYAIFPQVYSLCCRTVIVVMLLALTRLCAQTLKQVCNLTGIIAVSAILLDSTSSLVQLADITIQRMGDYAKLFFPVLSAAVTAQGGVNTSSALYIGTLVLDSVIGHILCQYYIPAVYLFLTLGISNTLLHDNILKRIGDGVKSLISWFLKLMLTIYITYINVAGVVGGTADAMKNKAAKTVISTVVPVVGGILSEASNAVVASAGLVKNSVGIYGLFAFLAILAEPFLRIGISYLLLKCTSGICLCFGEEKITELVDVITCTIGMLLAIIGAMGILLMVSTVCFMKGAEG